MEEVQRHQKVIGKTAGLLLVLVIYLSFFSIYGGSLIDRIFFADDIFDEGTTIGPEKVDEMTSYASAKLLNNRIEDWEKRAVITLKYAEKEVTMNNSLISFQVEQSVREAADGRQNPLLASVSPDELKEELTRKMPVLQTEGRIDLETVAGDISDIGDYLKSGESVVDLSLYLSEGEKSAKLAEVTADGLDSAAESFVKANPILPVKANMSVSFNSWAEAAGGKMGEESLNILASSLYQLVLKTNFNIMEKNQSNALPDDIELGYEARVEQTKEQDFVFFNPNGEAYTINWTASNGELRVSLTGVPFYYTYKTELRNKKTLHPKTVLHFSPELPYGEMQVEQYGEDGSMVDVYRSQFEGSQKLGSEQIAADFYPPVHQIELYSSQEPPPPPEPEETDEETDQDASSEAEDNTEEESQNEDQTDGDDSSSAEENSTENEQ
ncbi:G5 domain-containing protein [Domibacillus sp. DTU_2020_1001157_1_SI_ALB_TIR_016]|uniref:G5 domain-containing protein n=1 Tax=Domibacillus sp. DTU_2020_1001157_1_SI_ALB_TIR_016 TaxID=3077789 RepID=UPI0028ED2CD7|nr:G5 domain-containing protein [Domibacillus sp. DTU_2020_1001157_1_SI_ALB_TIR_016]WNS81811.1 G5 domain-containing protein [Domibacillus sp. DTU_2020_1001157_1_SI_ALB_TIR_016]